jgi:hypothetical protein
MEKQCFRISRFSKIAAEYHRGAVPTKDLVRNKFNSRIDEDALDSRARLRFVRAKLCRRKTLYNFLY